MGLAGLLVGFVLTTVPGLSLADDPTRATVVIVQGAPGAPEYEVEFQKWVSNWETAARRGRADVQVIGREAVEGRTDRELLRERLLSLVGAPDGETAAAQETASTDSRVRETRESTMATRAAGPLWIVLIGHGTFDGKVARFNLRGPDISSSDLREWLQDVARTMAIVDCSSCSGPFLTELSGANRAVITATRSGSEYNFARFGGYLSAAIADSTADLDKDDQTSLLEAFVVAGARLSEFYRAEARLASEHPLVDDNADRLGTPVDWFQGLRPTKAARSGATLDGPLASSLVLVPSPREERLTIDQRARRGELERQIADLRARRSSMSEDDFLGQLEPILVELARLYQDSKRRIESR